MIRPKGALLLLPLLAALACGGGSSTAVPAAKALAYVDPKDTSQWRLVKDAASTDTHLVLDLMAPDHATGMGVTLVLAVDGASATWGAAGGSAMVKAVAYTGPLARRESLAGSSLRILLSQENPASPAFYLTAPVLSVALDLRAGSAPREVSLAATQAGHLLAPQALPAPITIAVGTLTAR